VRALAQWILRGPLQAIGAVAGLAVAALLLPPLMLISAAALALVTLALGLHRGGQVLAGATAVIVLAGMLLTGNPWFGLALALVDWVPVWLTAAVLRAMRSLAVALGFAILLAVTGVVLVHVLVPDPAGLWRGWLEPLLSAPLADLGVSDAELAKVLDALSRLATGILASSVLTSTMLAVFIGRAWQGALSNPGGFGREFRALRLGRVPALAAVVAVGAASLWHQPLLFETALILLVAFAFEGIAFVHWLAHRSAHASAWLVGFYAVLILVLPQALPVVMGLGVVDGLFDLRRRAAGRSDTA